MKRYLVVCLFFWMGSVNASSISSLVGDKDGFGGETVAGVPANGTILPRCCFDNRTGSDPFFTDFWGEASSSLPSPIDYNHTYSLGGRTSTSAFLDLQTAGMGDNRGPWDVLFNGNLISSFGGVGSRVSNLEVILYSLAIDTSFLTGNDAISLVYQDTAGEGFVINFSELRIETVSAVPAPAAVWLFGTALIGLIGFGKRRKVA
jgi:hypothetical protein